MRPLSAFLACIACGGAPSGIEPGAAVQGTYVGSLHSIGFGYDPLTGKIVRTDRTTTEQYQLTATGPNSALLSGTLSGGDCAVPLTLKHDGTFTFASSYVCSQTNASGGFVYTGTGRWDDSGSLSFMVVTGQGATGTVYYDETLAAGQKL